MKEILGDQIIILPSGKKAGHIMNKMMDRRIKADPAFTIPDAGHFNSFSVSIIKKIGQALAAKVKSEPSHQTPCTAVYEIYQFSHVTSRIHLLSQITAVCAYQR